MRPYLHFLLLCMTIAFLSIGSFQGAAKTAKQKRGVQGPNACVECHKEEGEIWKNTHHHTTFRSMPRSKEAKAISRKLGIRRLKSESLCLNCHFTTKSVGARSKVISGISCESCHGAGRRYIDIHSSFSGKPNKSAESAAERKRRWAKSESGGMIRPHALYETAKTCFGCHLVPQEKLVNVGGHPPGSRFDLIAWSQGEVRHNVWYSKGKVNSVAKKERQRLMHLIGLGVELESALRAVGLATERKVYAFKMAKRVADVRDRIAALAKALPNVPELVKMTKFARSTWLRLNNKKALFAAADNVAVETLSIASNYDGGKFGSIDKFLPKPKDYRGQPKK
ncbi:MAG: cytochrome c family protein [Hyphomicrobiaceae bacterium]